MFSCTSVHRKGANGCHLEIVSTVSIEWEMPREIIGQRREQKGKCTNEGDYRDAIRAMPMNEEQRR